MADIITVQELKDASLDAQTLETFVNGTETQVNNPRLLPNVNIGSIAELRKKVQNKVDLQIATLPNGRKGYATLASAQAAQASLPANTIVEVTGDTDSNNGVYLWNGTTLVKGYDALTDAKNYADTLNTATNKAVNNLVKQDAQITDLFDLADNEGNIVAKITSDGMLYIVGLDKSVQLTIAENTNNITDLNDSVADINNKINTYPTNDLYSWLDSEGNIVAKITSDGKFYIVGLDKSVQLTIAENTNNITDLNDSVADINNKINTYPTNDLYSWLDSEGNIVAKITSDGKFYIVGLDKDIVTTLNNFATKSTTGEGVIKDTSLAATRTLKDTFTQPVQTVLNSLMYAQTGAKAPPPLHYFKQNYTIDSTWINNINQFGHSNSTRLSIATPYRADDGVVHPHILEFYNGFRGYRYIICITPYYLTNEAYENPCIYGSNDLINLTLLDGFTQPLDVRPLPQYSTGHNSDNTLAYDPKTGELICIWRQSLRNSDGAGTRTDALWMRKTKDGYTWTDKQRIFLSTKNMQAGGAGSPAIVYDVASEYWYMYVTTLSNTNDAMRLFRAKKLDEDEWEYVATLTLPFKPWHQDIKIVGNKVCMIVYCYPPDNTIYFGIADNFTNFTWTQNLLLENNAYKASFVPEFNTDNEISLKILYSTDASPSEASEKWRMYMHQTNFINANLGVTP